VKPSRQSRHRERHAIAHIGWLRAAVLGAHDGILSTASLIVGVAEASADVRPVLIAGGAGLIAGALSMAVGEYVSVSSQADVEQADLAREQRELHEDPVGEERELAGIYRTRGLPHDLAAEVANKLMEHDALEAHARDELGLTEMTQARPVQAALTSAASFAIGAAIPLVTMIVSPFTTAPIVVLAVSLLALALLGWAGARIGKAPVLRAIVRVVLLGGAAMGVTLGLGRLLGTAF